MAKSSQSPHNNNQASYWLVRHIKKSWQIAGNIFLIEFLMVFFIELPVAYLSDYLSEYLENQKKQLPKKRDNLIWHMGAGFCIILFNFLYGLTVILRHLIMSVTSPIDFMKVAYHIGTKCSRYSLISKSVGVIFAIASIFFSASLTAAVFSFILPLMISGAGSGGWLADDLNTVLGYLGLGTISDVINKITGVSKRFADIATVWFSLSILFPLVHVLVRDPRTVVASLTLVLIGIYFFFQSIFSYIVGKIFEKGVDRAYSVIATTEDDKKQDDQFNNSNRHVAFGLNRDTLSSLREGLQSSAPLENNENRIVVVGSQKGTTVIPTQRQSQANKVGNSSNETQYNEMKLDRSDTGSYDGNNWYYSVSKPPIITSSAVNQPRPK